MVKKKPTKKKEPQEVHPPFPPRFDCTGIRIVLNPNDRHGDSTEGVLTDTQEDGVYRIMPITT